VTFALLVGREEKISTEENTKTASTHCCTYLPTLYLYSRIHLTSLLPQFFYDKSTATFLKKKGLVEVDCLCSLELAATAAACSLGEGFLHCSFTYLPHTLHTGRALGWHAYTCIYMEVLTQVSCTLLGGGMEVPLRKHKSLTCSKIALKKQL